MKYIKGIVVHCTLLLIAWNLNAQPGISRIEYYLDSDPGYGNGIAISFAAGTNVSNAALNIDPASLSTGFHVLGIRSKNANGAWSLDNKWFFAKPFSATASAPVLKRIEYYLDIDPGYGKATNVSFSPGTNLSNLTINLDPAALSTGFHMLGIRSADSLGKWSLDNKWFFAKPFSAAGNAPVLKRVEYYLDTDPGFGKATNVSFSPGTNLSDIAINIDPAALSTGFHMLGIRSADSLGKWSLDNKWFFAKPFSGAASTPNLSRIEYYLDTDPGYGNATAVSFAPGTNLANLTINLDPAPLNKGLHILGIRSKNANGFWGQDNKWLFVKPFSDSTAIDSLTLVEYYIDTDPGYGKGFGIAVRKISNISDFNLSINISGLSTGSHHLFIRSKATNQAWSLDNKFDFTVTAAIPTPAIVLTSVSRKTVCLPDTLKVAYQKSGTYNAGNIFKVQLSNSSGSFSSPVVIGSFTSTGSGVISCPIPAGTPAGTKYRLRMLSTNPVVTGTTSTDSLIVKAAHPIPTITPSGAVSVCMGSTTNLTASNGFESYLWNTGKTTKQITVGTAGSYLVNVVDSGGCTGTSAPVTVTIKKAPDSIKTITGPTSVTANQTGVTYAITSAAGVTYAWTVPSGSIITSGQGTASIQVAFGAASGNVTVKGTNSCGTSNTKSIAVTVGAAVLAAKYSSVSSTETDELKLYPNPVSRTLYLRFVVAEPGAYYVELTDITGKILLRKSGKSSRGVNKIIFDMSKYDNGMYLINLKDKKNALKSIMFNKRGL